MSTSRVQLALDVTDLPVAVRFYADLFGVEPAKQRTGYANFVVADPPLKLVLFENPAAVLADDPAQDAGAVDDVCCGDGPTDDRACCGDAENQ